MKFTTIYLTSEGNDLVRRNWQKLERQCGIEISFGLGMSPYINIYTQNPVKVSELVESIGQKNIEEIAQ